MVEIRQAGGESVFSLKVQPNARSDRMVGEHGGALKVTVTAPPQKGKANAAVIALLSKVLGVPKSSIEIIRGEASRLKTVRIPGLSKDQLSELLGHAMRGGGKGGI